MFKSLLFILILLVSNELVVAQPIQFNVPLPDTIIHESNFFKIKEIAEKYFTERHTNEEEGSGYQVYKRWEHYWEKNCKPDGTMPNSDELKNHWLESQSFKKTRGFGANWSCMGPSNIDSQEWLHNGYGRINCICIDPNNKARIFIGTPLGGLWRSVDTGNTWQPLTDFLPARGVSGIAIDKNNSNTMYMSTGDRDGGNSISNGIYKSHDGGDTWFQLPNSLSAGMQIGSIEIDPSDSKRIFFSSNNGFYKSIDSGVHWSAVLNDPISDFKFMPNNSNVIYVVKNTMPKKIAKSIDNGNTFTDLSTPSDIANSKRTLLGVSNANPNVLYLYSSNGNYTSRIFKSSNAGTSFVLKNDSTDLGCPQCNYDMGFAVSNLNENLLYAGCAGIFRSVDGGGIWQLVNWHHYDIHHLLIDSLNHVYCADDGGIAISKDSCYSFIEKSKGLKIEQIYYTDLHQSTTNILANGLQDNGGVLFKNGSWQAFSKADGIDVAVDPTNSDLFYLMINTGTIFKKYNLITNVLDYIAGPPSGLNYEWVVPFEVTNDGTVYAGYKYIYRLDSSLNWQQITNTVATTTAMEADPSNPNRVLYATRNNLGFFEIIKNGSTQIINTLTNPTNSLWINSISIDELHPKRIYALSYSDVYMSVDSGVTWTTITSNLAGNNLQAIAHEKNSMFNNVYVATSASIYFRNDTMSSWEPYNFGLPNTSVTDLEINATEGYIVASTYGRSIWRSPLPALNVGIGSIKEDKILLFPNPSSTYFKISIEINEPSTYQVYDMGGNLQLKKSFTSIDKNTMFDISNLHEGNYIIDIVSANHYIRRKIYRGH